MQSRHKISNILLVTTNFWPEPTGTAPFATDLAIALSDGHNSVTVLTTFPHYPWWKIPKEFQNMKNREIDLGGVRILRTTHYVPSRSSLLNRIRYEISLLKGLREIARKTDFSNIDQVITIGSSFSGHWTGRMIAAKIGTPLAVIIHDLIGKGLQQSGIPGGNLIAKLVQIFESKVLRHAEKIAVISPAMKIALSQMKIDVDKMSLIPLYTTNPISEVDKQSARELLNFPLEAFLIIHAGNLGNKQNLENIIDSARRLRDTANVLFYFVGHGNQEAQLRRAAHGLPNVVFLPPVPNETFSTLLGAADLLLVSERESQLEMSLPSKLTSYFFSNRPVLASVPANGATAEYLKDMAFIVEPGNPQLLAETILTILEDVPLQKRMAQKTLNFAQENLELSSGRKRYLEWLSS